MTDQERIKALEDALADLRKKIKPMLTEWSLNKAKRDRDNCVYNKAPK